MQDLQQTNLDIYGAEPIPWSRALDQLQDDSARRTTWLATAGADGRPHVAGVGALWLDGKFYFTSGAGTKKSRDLTANPNCVVSVALPNLDLVVEGAATKVTDEATLQRVAERYTAQGWPAQVEDGALTAPYSAPSAGPPPWYLYVVTPNTAFGVATEEPYGAMRWRFMN
jgi:hypothetical protein